MNSTHYDAAYFAWQKSDGELGGILDTWKFADHIAPNDAVLDFGCGGGFLLSGLSCRLRCGVEINRAARAEAQQRIAVFASIEELPDDLLFDKIISNHALEHVENPVDVLRSLRVRLRPEGRAVFVLPAESWHEHRRYEVD